MSTSTMLSFPFDCHPCSNSISKKVTILDFLFLASVDTQFLFSGECRHPHSLLLGCLCSNSISKKATMLAFLFPASNHAVNEASLEKQGGLWEGSWRCLWQQNCCCNSTRGDFVISRSVDTFHSRNSVMEWDWLFWRGICEWFKDLMFLIWFNCFGRALSMHNQTAEYAYSAFWVCILGSS